MAHLRAELNLLRFGSAAFATALLVPFLISSSGCKRSVAWKQHSFETQDLSRSSNDVELPASLWKKIEGVLTGEEDSGEKAAKHEAPPEPEAPAHGAPPAEEGGGEHGGGGGGGADAMAKAIAPASLPTEFSPLNVYLIEKNRGVLGRINHELKFGQGGGEIDLRDYVQPLNGSFYFAVEFLPDVSGIKRRVFFLSNNVLRKIGRERLGSGCNRYFDVTSAFEKAMKGEGFLVNTTDSRHVSALAGTYFFAAVHEGKLHLASLTVKDSSQRSLQCRR